MKIVGHFSVSSKCAQGLNRLFNFLEMGGDSLLRHGPTRLLSLYGHRKILKYWPSVKLYFKVCDKKNFIFYFFKDFIYLCLERGGGKEKERERNISVWLPLT